MKYFFIYCLLLLKAFAVPDKVSDEEAKSIILNRENGKLIEGKIERFQKHTPGLGGPFEIENSKLKIYQAAYLYFFVGSESSEAIIKSMQDLRLIKSSLDSHQGSSSFSAKAFLPDGNREVDLYSDFGLKILPQGELGVQSAFASRGRYSLQICESDYLKAFCKATVSFSLINNVIGYDCILGLGSSFYKFSGKSKWVDMFNSLLGQKKCEKLDANSLSILSRRPFEKLSCAVFFEGGVRSKFNIGQVCCENGVWHTSFIMQDQFVLESDLDKVFNFRYGFFINSFKLNLPGSFSMNQFVQIFNDSFIFADNDFNNLFADFKNSGDFSSDWAQEFLAIFQKHGITYLKAYEDSIKFFKEKGLSISSFPSLLAILKKIYNELSCKSSNKIYISAEVKKLEKGCFVQISASEDFLIKEVDLSRFPYFIPEKAGKICLDLKKSSDLCFLGSLNFLSPSFSDLFPEFFGEFADAFLSILNDQDALFSDILSEFENTIPPSPVTPVSTPPPSSSETNSGSECESDSGSGSDSDSNSKKSRESCSKSEKSDKSSKSSKESKSDKSSKSSISSVSSKKSESEKSDKSTKEKKDKKNKKDKKKGRSSSSSDSSKKSESVHSASEKSKRAESIASSLHFEDKSIEEKIEEIKSLLTNNDASFILDEFFLPKDCLLNIFDKISLEKYVEQFNSVFSCLCFLKLEEAAPNQVCLTYREILSGFFNKLEVLSLDLYTLPFCSNSNNFSKFGRIEAENLSSYVLNSNAKIIIVLDAVKYEVELAKGDGFEKIDEKLKEKTDKVDFSFEYKDGFINYRFALPFGEVGSLNVFVFKEGLEKFCFEDYISCEVSSNQPCFSVCVNKKQYEVSSSRFELPCGLVDFNDLKFNCGSEITLNIGIDVFNTEAKFPVDVFVNFIFSIYGQVYDDSINDKISSFDGKGEKVIKIVNKVKRLSSDFLSKVRSILSAEKNISVKIERGDDSKYFISGEFNFTDSLEMLSLHSKIWNGYYEVQNPASLEIITFKANPLMDLEESGLGKGSVNLSLDFDNSYSFELSLIKEEDDYFFIFDFPAKQAKASAIFMADSKYYVCTTEFLTFKYYPENLSEPLFTGNKIKMFCGISYFCELFLKEYSVQMEAGEESNVKIARTYAERFNELSGKVDQGAANNQANKEAEKMNSKMYAAFLGLNRGE